MADNFSGVDNTIVNSVSEQLAALAPISEGVQTIDDSVDVLDGRMATAQVDAIAEMPGEANLTSHPADDMRKPIDPPEIGGEDANPIIRFGRETNYYDMSGDKHLVIFNHYTYNGYNAPPTRLGSQSDVERIKQVFYRKLGFLKPRVYRNLTCEMLWETVEAVRNEDYKKASCLCIIILTHGEVGGTLYAADGTYQLKDVISKFENLPTLAGKPKLFFVQACRGSEVDAGTEAADTGVADDCVYHLLPSHADFLIMRSSVEDFVSFIHTQRGSWLIQDLCTMLDLFHNQMDILQIITLVHRRVASRVTDVPRKENIHRKKQVPETRFTLTKFLKFTN